MSEDLAARVAAVIRDVPDFPEPGVSFKDITPLIGDGATFAAVVRDLADRHRGSVDVVAGLEARGFIFGAALAYELGVGFVPVRKAGKLPGRTLTVDYQLEYGSASVEAHTDALHPGAKVLVVDDVLATGGTAAAAVELLERAGGDVVALELVVEIVALDGRSRLPGRDVRSILKV